MKKMGLVALCILAGCLSDDETNNNSEPPAGAPPTPAVVYGLVDDLYTTLQATWRPKHPGQSIVDAYDADFSIVTHIDTYDTLGLGVELGDGEPWNAYNTLAPGYADYITTPDRAEPVSLLYFWHSADQQLIDEESPIRYAGVFKPPLLTASAYRPHGHLTTQAFEAHVRTANAIAAAGGRPYDFGIVTGDMTDGSQANETDWFLTAMAGGVIDPDSGINDDPVAGPGNDYNDPFTAEGFNAPWYAVIGNHESLYIGSSRLNEEIRAGAVSDEVFTDGIEQAFGFAITDFGIEPGFRDGSTVNGDIVTYGNTPSDPAREILDTDDVLIRIQQAGGQPAGHGMTAADAAAGNGDFVFTPVAGNSIKVIAFNTVYRDEMDIEVFEYSEGFMTSAQLDWLTSELTAAEAANELVILASHHRSSDFNDESPVSGEQLVQLIGDFDNVVLHLTGHGHYSATEFCQTSGECLSVDEDEQPAAANNGYWELMVPSTADFPIQSRIMELVYEGQDYLSIYGTNIDHNSPVDSLGHEARRLAAGRRIFQDSDYLETWTERAPSRNLILRIQLPAAVAAQLESETWPDRIESTETLLKLTGP